MSTIKLHSFVEIIENNHHTGQTGIHVCCGYVHRETMFKWIVINEHGNECHVHKDNLHVAGRAEPRDKQRIVPARKSMLVELQIRFIKRVNFNTIPDPRRRELMKAMRTDLDDLLWQPTVQPGVTAAVREDLKAFSP
jgi:hypothetical protein